MKKVFIYGIGNFGYALLKHLDKYKSKEYIIGAYDRNKKIMNSLIKKKSHPLFHKNIKISKNIIFVHNLPEFARDSDIIILAVYSNAIKEVLLQINPYLKKGVLILNTAKALNSDGRTFSQIHKKLGIKGKYSLIAGGTIARDLFKHEPLGIDLASKDKRLIKEIIRLLSSENLKVYAIKDLKGVEMASALKNVVSIFAGIINGLGFSYGSETHFISRFSKEIKNFAVEKGAKKETFNMERQCWGNDLWMSALGDTRNRKFGTLIGKGKHPRHAEKEMHSKNKTVEGLNTLRALRKIIKNKQKYPILNSLIEIIFENKNPKTTLESLMNKNHKDS